MRCMMKVSFPVESSNALAKSGALGTTLQSIIAELKPEAAYFCAVDGKRGAYLFFNLDDSSQIPAVAEPWFLAANASVEILPVMSTEDFGKAQSGIAAAVKKYGK